MFSKKILHSSHILICRTDNIGDVVLTLPMVQRVRELNPQAKISFLCRSYAAEVVRYCSSVDEVIELEQIASDLTGYLKASDIDTVIIAQPDRALTKAAFRAGIANRIGNARQKLYLLFYCNRRVRFSKGLSNNHEAQINFEFLRPFGSTNIPLREEIPALYRFNIPANSDIEELISKNKFNLIFHTKSNGHGKEWPIQHFIELAKILAPLDGLKIWLTGSPSEGKWLESNAPELLTLSNVKNVCGHFTLSQLTTFIKMSDGLIASGTGPLHLSAAIGQRTIGLFPPTRPMHAGRWGALGKSAVNLCATTECSQCQDKDFPTCSCMEAISPAEVSSIVQQWYANR